jgi:hypothetical protein
MTDPHAPATSADAPAAQSAALPSAKDPSAKDPSAKDPSAPDPEHFVTIFNGYFLPQALCLHHSLMQHAQPFVLWVLCIDEAVEADLKKLDLPHVRLIPLREMETPELAAVRPGRTVGEYCWTLIPFSPPAVLARDPSAKRATYIDTDLYFFSSPKRLLDELTDSGKDLLITDHAFDPEYAKPECGRFCVQFLPMTRTESGRRVWEWWQGKVIEWCFARVEPGRFGDQVYLDDWETRYPKEVHVLQHTERTLAPWNVNHMAKLGGGKLDPVIYHFHGLRPYGRDRLMLWNWDYRIGPEARELYMVYLEQYIKARARLKAAGIELRFTANPGRSLRERWRVLKMPFVNPGAIVKLPE